MNGKIADGKKKIRMDTLSQRQLMLLRFKKHKLAVAGVFFLAMLYFVAVIAGFFAPYADRHENLNYAYCPPHKIGFSPEKGLYAKGITQKVDPVTLAKYYEDAPQYDAPLGFFVKGDEYYLLGMLKTSVHLVGVDYSKIKTAASDAERYVWFLAGSDQFGQDVFSRIIFGARISLSVGLIGVAISFVLGLTIGGISGYCAGMTDTIIQRILEIIGSLPQIPIWLALAAAVPMTWDPLRTYFAITIILSFLSWTGLARVVRGKILALRNEDFVVAARLLGASDRRILFKHLLPSFMSHIIVSLTLVIPAMILAETSLSFLGIGLRAPIVSWGVMLQECMNVRAILYYPWILAPVIIMVATVLCFNFLGDGLRDAADPYSNI